MEEKIFEVKVERKKGMFYVQCPLCKREHFGNALDGFLRNKKPMSCRDNGTGCKAILQLIE